MSPKKIVVADYSPDWLLVFDSLKNIYQQALGDLLIDIQHVGSTSVPGLAAKPVIDVDLVINDRWVLPAVIEKNSASLRNHLQFRDYLRTHPEKAHEYGQLKKDLAAQDSFDIDRYVMLKTPFITGILKLTGFNNNDLEKITEQNKAK